MKINTYHCANTRNKTSSNRHHIGFSLIELLTTLAVVALSLGLGISGLSQWLQHQTEATLFRSLQQISTFARTRAIKDGQYFTVCASQNNTDCQQQWQQQIIVFNDKNTNEVVDKDEALYRVLPLPDNAPCILWKASLGRHYLQFKPSGASNGTAGHFRFCDSQSNNKLVVGLSGRTSIKSL
ncbi:GspH/FimT family pseudopilin [Oceanicoccus sagamiensis]|uniref:Type II secretion system protein H n=1 Tax=Oceanicoccus sagamiensis TaxID=716816 RepID=A0A1X9NBB6_9GAMM|nr:GspH/FimT family pseudopilin [Oceanicoccus sagamiensis]ARN72839.1 hypothetical protein BST96_01195 [Oceanicoccus sagamiensis]